MIVDLIENRNFNKMSLGGPNLNDLSRFNKYITSIYEYNLFYKRFGFVPYNNGIIQWWGGLSIMDTFD
jgi:hypothetical protein